MALPGAGNTCVYDCATDDLSNEAYVWCKENSCVQARCPKDICWDGRGRRQIGDDCCACPSKPFNCLTKDVWTTKKQDWCCKNEERGCPSRPLKPAEFGEKCEGFNEFT